MTYNVPLFRKIYRQITEHPETHDQRAFESTYCGTQRCIAGWAVALHFGLGVGESIYRSRAVKKHATVNGGYGGVMADNGVWLSDTAHHAADLLNLPYNEAAKLFYYMNDEGAVEKCRQYAYPESESSA